MNKRTKQPVDSYTEFEKLNWVSNKPFPQVGTKVNVKVNSIGESVVKKYFVEYGFIGLLVQPLDPPEWYVEQNGADEPCHVFPAEVEELQVRNEDKSVDEAFYQTALDFE